MVCPTYGLGYENKVKGNLFATCTNIQYKLDNILTCGNFNSTVQVEKWEKKKLKKIASQICPL